MCIHSGGGGVWSHGDFRKIQKLVLKTILRDHSFKGLNFAEKNVTSAKTGFSECIYFFAASTCVDFALTIQEKNNLVIKIKDTSTFPYELNILLLLLLLKFSMSKSISGCLVH